MKITVENTAKLVEIEINGVAVPARIWQGESEGGIPVQLFVTRIAPEIRKTHPDIEELLTAQFEHELRSVAAPRPSVAAIPLRMIL